MVLKAVSGLAGGALLPAGLVLPALAADHPALGTYPAGSSGDSVFVGVSVPRTGTYAAAGEDLIKGYELALERSEEHTSELQSLMRISYAVFCLKKKKTSPAHK